MRTLFGLALLGLAAACKAPPLPESAHLEGELARPADWSPLTLGPGDRLRIEVFEYPELSTDEQGVRVDVEGNVHLPLIGPVPASGLRPGGLRDAIALRLSEYVYDPAVTVSVIDYGARNVYVVGQVREPGRYVMDRPLTALQALTLGGGPLTRGDDEHVALIRRIGDELVVHTFDMATPGPEAFVQVLPDDVIFVRKRGSVDFREDVAPYLISIGSVQNALALGLTAKNLAN